MRRAGRAARREDSDARRRSAARGTGNGARRANQSRRQSRRSRRPVTTAVAVFKGSGHGVEGAIRVRGPRTPALCSGGPRGAGALEATPRPAAAAGFHGPVSRASVTGRSRGRSRGAASGSAFRSANLFFFFEDLLQHLTSPFEPRGAAASAASGTIPSRSALPLSTARVSGGVRARPLRCQSQDQLRQRLSWW